MKLRKLLLHGAVLRYREGFGFYLVSHGKASPVTEPEVVAALRSGLVRPEGGGKPDKFGVYHFAMAGTRI